MTTDLAALVGSRICHDLINPLGAIGNGLELLSLAGLQAGGDEISLIEGSTADALAKLRFLRIAFGDAREDQIIARRDILSVLTDLAPSGRLTYAWQALGDPNRVETRLAFLSIMCVTTALPSGGDILIRQDDDGWSVEAQDPALSLDPALWAPLAQGAVPDALSPAQVQFGLLAKLSQNASAPLSFDHGADWVRIRF